MIMAKQPLIGAVKTRLCPPLSVEQALLLYQAFLADTIRLVAAACRLLGSVSPAIAYSPATAYSYFRALAPSEFVLLPQQGANFGERLSGLPAQAQARGYGHVAMIDSDSPTLPPEYAARCFTELARPEVDYVLGPCTDGGYYLIGLKQPQPALFAGISWSTSVVTAQTLAAGEQAGLHGVLLPTWYDIDTADDLATLRAELRAEPQRAPQTSRVLAADEQNERTVANPTSSPLATTFASAVTAGGSNDGSKH